ncbi:MAG: outer membrane protein [Pseudolabrys sp.]
MTTTIRAGVAAAAVLIASIAAQAADLSQPFYKAPGFAPVYGNWNGFYAGINGGYGFGTSDWSGAGVGTSPKGGLVGGTLGYNLQTGLWVWGVEGDIDWSNIKGDASCGADTCETKNDWLATVRGRLGYAGLGAVLPYITGGGAAGDIKTSESVLGSTTKTKIGWTVGGGLEYAVWANWSVKAEYLYVDLGSSDCGLSCGAAGDSVNFHTHLIRGGVNYRF